MEDTTIREAIRGLVDDGVARGELPHDPGLAVAVVREGAVLLRLAMGQRDRARRLPVTPRTVFDVASCTKSFTAMACLLAASEARLELAAPVNAGRIEVQLRDEEATRRLTLDDLLAHRTGLPPHDLLWYFGRHGPDVLTSRLALLEPIPGGFRREFLYNNLTFTAAGQLLGARTGMPWQAWVDDRLLAPLGMRRSATRPAPDLDDDVALPHGGPPAAHGPLLRRRPPGIPPASALRACLDDLAVWLGALTTGGRGPDGCPVLPARVVAAAFEARAEVEALGPILGLGIDWLEGPFTYGYGWAGGSRRRTRVLVNPGYLDGFSCLLAVVPEHRLGVVALANANLSPLPGLAADRVLDVLLGQVSARRAPRVAPAAPASPSAAPTPAPADASGRFRNPVYGDLQLRRDEAGAVIGLEGSRWPLRFGDERTATLELTAMGIPMTLPVELVREGGTLLTLLVPLALDPRAPPLAFVRTGA